MEKKVKVSIYSEDARWFVKNEGKNISGILDRLIRLTAKYTSYYASDILYEINELYKAHENKSNYVTYLFFRESGVTSKLPSYLEEYLEKDQNTKTSNVWKLSYKDEVTTLCRVTVRLEEVN